MKLLFVPTLIITSLLVSAAAAQVRPIPLGIREAAKAEEQADRNIPPPMMRHSTPNLEKVREDADQLAKLAESIPSDVERTVKGAIPNDLNNRLKEIEKLAKKLRGELSPR